MAFIFAMSTGLGSAEHTIGLLGSLIRAYMPDAEPYFGPRQLEFLNYLVRKLGHINEYIVLTALAARAFQYGSSRLRWKSILGAMAVSVCYAVLDEAHQYFVPHRTASMKDVLIDSAGSVICGVLIVSWFGIKGIERRYFGGGAATK
jgi:VanZ family protein